MLFGTDELSELPRFVISPFNGVSLFSFNFLILFAVFAVESVTESFFYSYLLNICIIDDFPVNFSPTISSLLMLLIVLLADDEMEQDRFCQYNSYYFLIL